jgi:hypothetical protein
VCTSEPPLGVTDIERGEQVQAIPDATAIAAGRAKCRSSRRPQRGQMQRRGRELGGEELVEVVRKVHRAKGPVIVSHEILAAAKSDTIAKAMNDLAGAEVQLRPRPHPHPRGSTRWHRQVFDEALRLSSVDIDLQHRVIHVHLVDVARQGRPSRHVDNSTPC